MTNNWTAKYPDLTGKTAIVTGESAVLVDVCHALAANGLLVAVVAIDRDVVDRCVQIAEQLGADVFGLAADPASADVWARVQSHIEQRLGPIDIVVSAGPPALRHVIRTSLLPDMSARHRGVLVEIDATVDRIDTAPGVRHRGIETGSTASPPAGSDVAVAALLCASDLLIASWSLIVLEAT